MEVCSESHLLPTEFCPSTVEAQFSRDGQPTEECHLHAALEVPDVVGMGLADAQALLEQAGFQVSVGDDPSSTGGSRDGGATGSGAGSKGGKQSVVVLTVSLGAPEEVEVPLLLGLRVAEARAALEHAGLSAEESLEADDSPAGTVIRQDVEAGTTVRPGRR